MYRNMDLDRTIVLWSKKILPSKKFWMEKHVWPAKKNTQTIRRRKTIILDIWRNDRGHRLRVHNNIIVSTIRELIGMTKKWRWPSVTAPCDGQGPRPGMHLLSLLLSLATTSISTKGNIELFHGDFLIRKWEGFKARTVLSISSLLWNFWGG